MPASGAPPRRRAWTVPVCAAALAAWMIPAGVQARLPARFPSPASELPDHELALDDRLRMNEIQVIGTHNSYKRPLPPDELAAHRDVDPAGAASIDYAHRPLGEQLDMGLRSLELDVYSDPQGGRFLHPPGAQRRGYRAPPWNATESAQMREPGFKVMHLADIDFRSTCVSLRACLAIARDWSQAHPRHVPILVLINAKDGPGGAGSTPPLRFDAQAFDALDAEIRAWIPASQLLVPDDVQGDAPTLRTAVRSRGWPTLAQARGRLLFALDEGAGKVAIYRGHRRSLEGRAMFVNSAEEDSPAAAYLTLNDPVADGCRIARALANGYLVRTRADADTVEARSGDTRRRAAAFATGAQVVSTDYPSRYPHVGSYRVAFADGGFVRAGPSRAARTAAASRCSP